MARGAISPQGSGQWDDSMLLPPHLREWVVDSSQVHYLKRPDGKLWQIGSGASSKVYRVEYRGEVRSAGLDCKQQQQQQEQQQQRHGLVALLGAWRCRHLAWRPAHSTLAMCLPVPDHMLRMLLLPFAHSCWLPRRWIWGAASRCARRLSPRLACCTR